MSEWVIALIASGALATLLVWAFQWGKKRGNVNNRLKNLEGWVSDPPMRPECSEVFTEIKENLASVSSKVDTMLVMMRENQKNNEKKHTQGRQ